LCADKNALKKGYWLQINLGVSLFYSGFNNAIKKPK
jgi:hypothetical protein